MSGAILLTGGFGAVGGRLAALLSARPDMKVRLASRRIQDVPSWAPRAETVRLELLDAESIKPSVNGIDTIVHLAALNDIECLADPVRAHEVNVEGTRNLVKCAVEAGVRRIIYMSTAHVYGSPLAGFIDESNPTRPTHPYAVTHLEAEQIIADAHTTQLLCGIRLRSANGFGAPMDSDAKTWQILVNDLCRQAVEMHKLRLKTYGDQQRNFISLKDVCTGITHMIVLDQKIVRDGLFNLGSANSHSIWRMATRVAQRCDAVLGFEPPITRPTQSDNQNEPLDYRSDKIRSTGFFTSDEFDREIDQLLRFCSKEFRMIK